MKWFCILFVSLIGISLNAHAQTDSVTLSEVMFYLSPNDPDLNEFVEIYNFGSQGVNVANWRLRDNLGQDTIKNAGYGTILQPGQFGVIFTKDYNIANGIYSPIVPPAALILKIGTSNIGNGLGLGDSLRLINISGDTVSRVKWSYSGTTISYGQSIEKIVINNHNNASSNWSKGLTNNGTPGAKNSVSPFDYDLSISGRKLSFSPANPKVGFTLGIQGQLKNTGLQTIESALIKWFLDTNENMNGDPGEEFDSTQVDEILSPGDSLFIETEFELLTAGLHRFIAQIIPSSLIPFPDENPANNKRADTVRVSDFAQADSITFTEVMFKPVTALDKDEFVELYNFGTQPVNLLNWRLRDYTGLDTIKNAGYGTILQPGQFAVIFPLSYDISTGYYKDLIPADALILKVHNNQIGNSLSTTDIIKIINASGDTVNIYYYSAPDKHPAGYSYEKINLTPINFASNWSATLSYNGTPGALNTVSPVDYDVSIYPQDIQFSPPFPSKNSIFTVSAAIRNTGLMTSGPFSVKLARIRQIDTLILAEESYPSMASGASVTISGIDTAFALGGVIYRAQITHDLDQKSFNNQAAKPLLIGTRRNSIIVNEVLHTPSPTTTRTEWFELVNISSDTIDLLKWKYADESALTSGALKTITTTSVKILPGEYFILCDNISNFNAQYPGVTAKKIRPSAWLGLTESDLLFITDSLGSVVDSVFFEKSWGGGSNISIERKFTDSIGNDPLNWGSSIALAGATPGTINSLTPVSNDIGVTAINFSPPFPSVNQTYSVSVTIKNFGSITADTIFAKITRRISSHVKTLWETVYYGLTPGQSLSFAAPDTAIVPGQIIEAEIFYSRDMKSFNDVAKKTLLCGIPRNSLVINEVLYSPSPTNTYSEWIEIYNRSADTLNLMKWKVADEAAFSSGSLKTLTTSNIRITPGEYIILCEDSVRFKAQYPNVSARKFRPSAWIDLGESDMIVIADSLGSIVDSLFYEKSWGGASNKSLERKDANASTTIASNWGTSIALAGGTPGTVNSLTETPYDAGIASLGFVPAFPEKDQVYNVEVVLKNYGTLAADTVRLNVFRKTAGDSVLLRQSVYFNLTDTINVSVTDTALGSGQTIRAEIIYSKDQKSFNNTASKTLIFGVPRNSMVINEIMYSPLSNNAEWIEIVNRSADTLDLQKWLVADEAALTSNSFKTIVSTNQRVVPGEHIIICEDSAKFKTQYPWVTARKFRPSAWIPLNESDMIVLTDSLRKIVDSVFYEKSWGGASNKSLERKDANASTMLASNWGTSIALAGGTPGTVNSLTETPYDAGIASLGFVPAFPEKDQVYNVEVVLKNYGTLAADTVRLNVFRKTAGDSVLLRQSVYFNLTDTINVSVTDTALGSGQTIRAEIIYSKDQKSFNNTASKTLIFGVPRNSMVINEIMYSPLSNNAEWIEIVNRSADTLDLQKWLVADEAALTSNSFKTIVSTNQRVVPGEHIIICEDSAKFKTQYPWVTARKFRPSAWIPLNESDMIVLTDSLRKIVDSVFYEKSWGGASNKSLERKDANASTMLASNWGTSIALAGATPGYVNSLTPFDFDLSVLPSDLFVSPTFPQPGDTLKIRAVIRNTGLLTVAESFIVKLYEDGDFNGTGSQGEIIDSLQIDSLPANQTFLFECRFLLSAGNIFKRMAAKYFASADSIRFLIRVDYSGDQRPENNFAFKTIRIGVKPQSVVINEILYYPDTNQVEFVEIFNRSHDTINLKNWTVADFSPTGKKTISTADLFLFPGHYRVITGDTTVFRKYPALAPEKIIIVKSLAAFNNDKDAVVIKDAIGAIVDSFYYYSSWGGKKGVSLERIDVNRSSNDPGNWGSSIAVGGASLGTVNGILTAKPAFRNALVINEIMYAPFTGEPEYIEFYNPTDSALNLANWSLQVNETKVILTTVSYEIPAGEYAVISENRNMPARYKSVPRLMKLSSMPGLSNTGATVMIRDMVGTVIDSVTYDPDWGGQNGLSLERIRPLDNGNARTSWGSCMFVEGGTPGYRNSIYTDEDQPNKIKLSAEPNPFFVDRNEQTKITIELPVTQARLTLKIYDNQGRLIRTLLNNSYSGSYREVLWDGRDNGGHFARMGIYVMYLEAVNENPKFNKSAKKTVVLGRKL